MKQQNRTEKPALPSPPGTRKPMSAKSRWLWSVLSVLIAAGTIWAVMSQSKSFSLTEFGHYLESASIPWLLASLAGMFFFIMFEGLALLVVARAFGYRKKLRNGFVYSASDIYFSAITPSATGGQPASAFFMIRDGIPPSVVAVALLANLSMYTLSIIAIGIVSFAVRPDLFFSFSTLSKVLILVGCAIQFLLAVGFFLLLKNEKILLGIGRALIRFLGKIKLIRHPDRKCETLERMMKEYRDYVEMLSGHRRVLVVTFLFNLIQRASQIAVTMFTFLATGGGWRDAGTIWILQSYVVLGSNCVPIPGAMGVSDYLMIDGFQSLMDESAAVHLELLARSISFYICILVCGICTLLAYLFKKRRLENE